MKKKFLLTTLTMILCISAIGTLTACGEKHTHSYVESITAPTCTEQGFSTYTCSCGDSYVENYVNALGHTYDQENTASKYLKTEATCTNVAVYWKSCSCGEKGSETFNYGTTLPHDFGTYSKTQNATCTENAKETAYCQNKGCNEPDVRDIEGTVLGHGDINTNNVCSVCNKEVAYTKGMIYVAVTGGYQLIDMGSATDTDIIIPKYYNGSPVISIADEVFKNKTTLTSITLPDTIEEIGCYAFLGCSKIKELILPKSVKCIGISAFARCISLEYMTIPCFKMKYSSGGKYEAALEDWLMESTSLTSLIPKDATVVYSEKISSSLTFYYYWYGFKNLKKVTVLDTVESIPETAFYVFDMIEEIELPNTIKTIGNHAFRYCSSLKSINIPDSVTSIGNSAFGSCYNLQEVNLGSGLIKIDAYAFESCTSLTEISISSSVNSIGNYAFSGCTQLNKITFKNTSGWKVGSNGIDVSDASTNAILFKRTYVGNSWSRS